MSVGDVYSGYCGSAVGKVSCVCFGHEPKCLRIAVENLKTLMLWRIPALLKLRDDTPVCLCFVKVKFSNSNLNLKENV